MLHTQTLIAVVFLFSPDIQPLNIHPADWNYVGNVSIWLSNLSVMSGKQAQVMAVAEMTWDVLCCGTLTSSWRAC